ncbi:MAG: flagellar hook-basal body complex protein FliE [Idiomarina sp.]|nr:flagellar hook-basal body complex protein FliE [Idiomarina sp.]
MNIQGSSSLYAEMQSMLAELRSTQQVGPTPPSSEIPKVEGNTARADFGGMLKGAIDNINNLQMDARNLQTRLEMGDQSVSLAETMIAASKSSIAFEAGVQVRNKVVDAYEKIMNMPV